MTDLLGDYWTGIVLFIAFVFLVKGCAALVAWLNGWRM
jgi:hypothetical protein